ncbi:MAG TPA: phosphoribosylanthranilate isomerase [Pyrinomonadaceae bacterium]|nr:phosphoribosylanthranilate isomerase [Pyrinomonadaceae bacterium]
MLVKICGITNLDDALTSVEAGAGALGFNFYRLSPRYIEPRDARAIIERLPANVLKVGVFVNEAAPEIVEAIAREAGVDALQLHGDESPDFCVALKHRYVIKALAVTSDFEPTRVLDYEVEAIMLDGFHKHRRGGTGNTFDWSIARRTGDLFPKLFLAGGLSPENIAAAIHEAQPFAVDACSALEIEPGKKDHELVRSFVAAALGLGSS